MKALLPVQLSSPEEVTLYDLRPHATHDLLREPRPRSSTLMSLLHHRHNQQKVMLWLFRSTFVICPATADRKCSMVERLSLSGEQKPDYLCVTHVYREIC